jgi:serine/threonine protein kinase
MPDNTWFTPYKFSSSTCLSIGPSQGIVYAIPNGAVVKLPFQYPVSRLPPTDDTIEQMEMSLRSLALFKKESTFYDVLAKNQHPNLAQRLQTVLPIGIVLPRYESMGKAWSSHTRAIRLTWIGQLVSAVARLEDLGYAHGDLKVLNMGIDGNNQLQLFDFGSVIHCADEGFAEQVVEDGFALATCIHFLASGVDLLAKANSRSEIEEMLQKLKSGQGIVDEAAKDFEQVIQAGWTGSLSTFSSLRKSMTEYGNNAAVQQNGFLPAVQPNIDFSAIEQDNRWMDEDVYRAAWTANGYETPGHIWE